MNLLEAQIAEFIDTAEGDFNDLAIELFRFQVGANPAYANYVSTVREDWEGISRWEEIPTLPISAFKEAAITTFPVGDARIVFKSSGTTASSRSNHYLQDPGLYELSIVSGWPSRPIKPVRIYAFSPSPAEASDSSLVYMFKVLIKRFGDPGSGFTRESLWLGEELERARKEGLPVWLLGTAISLNRLADALKSKGSSFEFGSWLMIMETGGFKGHEDSVPQAVFYRKLCGLFGIPVSAILSEYSMSEISSQFYNRPDAPERAFNGPPWVRWRVVHPLSGEPVANGERGILEIFDLANMHSALAIRTDDIVSTAEGDGFLLQGRVPRAPAKGCSLVL